MVEYSFYIDTYHGGSIPEAEWIAFEARAAEQLNRLKRIYTVSAPNESAESMAICAMAEALNFFSAAVNGGLATATAIGSVSTQRTSTSVVDISPKAQEKELYRCASLYLDIYRGVSGCSN